MQDLQTLEELGYRLGRKREEHGATLEHCARALHIRAKYLAALEAGRFTDIPGDAYARGYLQNYAAFLGFDRVEVVAAFDRVSAVREQAGRSFYLPEVLTRENKPSKTLVVASCAAAVAFYALWSVVHARPPGEAASMIAVAGMRELTENKAEKQPAIPCAESISAFPPCTGTRSLPAASLLLPPRMWSVVERDE